MSPSTEPDLPVTAAAPQAMAGKLTMDGRNPEMLNWLGKMVEAQGPDAAETTYLWVGLGMSV